METTDNFENGWHHRLQVVVTLSSSHLQHIIMIQEALQHFANQQ